MSVVAYVIFSVNNKNVIHELKRECGFTGMDVNSLCACIFANKRITGVFLCHLIYRSILVVKMPRIGVIS